MSQPSEIKFSLHQLLRTMVEKGASDLHITTGQPPCVRRHGRLVRLETKTLGPEDTTALMKSITPERNQQELQEEQSPRDRSRTALWQSSCQETGHWVRRW